MVKLECHQINVTDIIPTRDNPRVVNEKSAAFQELTESIKAGGVKIPIHIRPHPKKPNHYELLAGERRLRVCKKIKTQTIPAVIHHDMTDEEAFELTFAENFAREDLTPLEQGKAVAILLESYKDDAKAAASKMGKSERWIRLRSQLHKGLSDKWKKELKDEDSEFIDWTAAHLCLVARFPKTTQDDLLEEPVCCISDLTVALLDQHLTACMQLLDKAPWNTEDPRMLPKAGSCLDCSKRSGFQPTLWGKDGDPQKTDK